MTITTCCGCCSLQKGSIIIGFLYFISGASSVIYLGMILSQLFSLSDDFEVQLLSARSITVGCIFYAIILLILSGVLIVGAINRVVNYVFFFVSMSLGNIIVTITYFVYEIAFMFMMPSIPPVSIVIYFACVGIGMSINVYLWLVVYHFYQELITNKFQKLFQHNTISYAHPVVPGMIYS